jgi:broad specificity phosphatase PhoE
VLTLVLTRHGLTDRSVPEQHLGQRIDAPLNAAGRRQASQLAVRLGGIDFDRVITSPLVRARETAEIVAANETLETDPRLLEMDYGAWEGKTYADLERDHAAARRRWEQAPDVLRYPGGESGNDVAARVRDFLDDLLEDHVARHGAASDQEGPVLAVGHSSTNRILMCVALGLPIREFRQRFVQGQANITVLRFEHGDGASDARLIVLNDMEHLLTPGTPPWG